MSRGKEKINNKKFKINSDERKIKKLIKAENDKQKKKAKRVKSKREITSKKVSREEQLAVIQSREKKVKVKKAEPNLDIYDNNYKKEQDKRLMMWAGVTFFMVLILFVWVLNIKKVFNNIETDETAARFNWSEIKGDFTETIGQVKENWNELKQIKIQEEDLNKLPENIAEGELSKEEIVELKGRLEELEKKLEAGIEEVDNNVKNIK